MMIRRKIQWWVIGLFFIAGSGMSTENGWAAQKIFLKNGTVLECDSFFLGLQNKYLWYQKSLGLAAVLLTDVDADKTFDEEVRAILGKRFEYDSVDLARKFLELSGMEKAIPLLGHSAMSGLSAQQQKSGLPIAVYERLLFIVKKAYDFFKIKNMLLEQIAESMDSLRAQEVLEWLESPLGRRITELEDHASAKSSESYRVTFAKIIQSNPPATERLALYGRFEQAVGTAESVANLITLSFAGIAKGMNEKMPLDFRLDPDTLERELALEKNVALQRFEESSKIDFLFTYKDLSDKELEAYVEFAESNTGRWYHEMLFNALNTVQSRVSEEMGKAIVDVITSTPTS